MRTLDLHSQPLRMSGENRPPSYFTFICAKTLKGIARARTSWQRVLWQVRRSFRFHLGEQFLEVVPAAQAVEVLFCAEPLRIVEAFLNGRAEHGHRLVPIRLGKFLALFRVQSGVV